MRALKELIIVQPSDLKVPVDQYMWLLELGLGKLNDQERQAIFLRFWEPFTIAQVADRMRISWDEANQLIDDAVEKLRGVMRDRLSRQGQNLETKTNF